MNLNVHAYKRECGLMNANGTWPHQFISERTRSEMTSFWQAMQRHSQEDPDWTRDTDWTLGHSASRVNWAQCQIQNWDYQWFLHPTRRAPQWQDLPESYRQWWKYAKLPTHSGGLDYYLGWLKYEDGEFDRKRRQLQGWKDEWNGLSQLTKMQYFDPILPTAYVHERKMQVGNRCGPNPYTLKIVGDW